MTQNNETLAGRRPLKVRSATLSKNIATWLSKKNITPNQISVSSLLFASCSAFCLFAMPHSSVQLQYLLLICAAAFIQCRLLCNLFDGMVAVEGGKGTISGELFNDIPDRIADPLIIIAAGYSITIVPWASSLGWFSALLSIMTAYDRTLSVSIGAPVNFSGPMAKQHRMAIITIACLIGVIENYFWNHSYTMLISLFIIASGCIITAYRRVIFTYNFLEKNNK